MAKCFFNANQLETRPEIWPLSGNKFDPALIVEVVRHTGVSRITQLRTLSRSVHDT